MVDLISRNEAIAYIKRAIPNWSEDKETALDCLENMPSVQPTAERQGRWERKADGVYCSACYLGWDFMTGVPAEVETDYHYCPNCGAKMDEVEP